MVDSLIPPSLPTELSSEHFSVIYNSSPIAIELYDNEGNLIDINPACIELFGIEAPEELKGFRLFDDPNLPAAKIDLIKKGFAIRNELNFSFDIVKKHNLYKTTRSGSISLEALITPVKDSNGEVSNYLVQLMDNTEKKLAEEKLKSYTQGLKELNRTKDELFSIIAHDLRTPFQSLIGITQLLSSEFEELPAQDREKLLESLDTQARTTYRLLEILLEWAKIQTGKKGKGLGVFNLKEEAEFTLQLFIPPAKNKSIKIEIVIDGSIDIYADKNTFATILRNLTGNAIKFTNPGGRVIISARRLNGFAEITVSDTGIGMNAEKLDNVFKDGRTVSSKGTAGEAGSALGLTLVKEMVEQNGGSIRVESEPDKGTSFHFTLPAR